MSDCRPLKSGQHSVHILLYGQDITGSPVSFYVSPSSAHPGKCYLSRASEEPTLVNHQCEITLTTHDKYGNQLDRGGVRVDAKAQGVAAGQCTVEDHKDGTYTIRLTAALRGEGCGAGRFVDLKPYSVMFVREQLAGPGGDASKGAHASADAGRRRCSRCHGPGPLLDASSVPQQRPWMASRGRGRQQKRQLRKVADKKGGKGKKAKADKAAAPAAAEVVACGGGDAGAGGWSRWSHR